MPSAYSVGLTGGVGSGKSTIAAALSEHGAAIVDADAIAHQLTAAGGAAIEAVRQLFGAAAIAQDGSLDRARMRAVVFSDPTARARLESLLHPMVRTTMRKHAGQLLAAGAPYIVYVVPLLIETGNWHGYVDRVLVIDCAEDTQVARVCARGLDAKTVRSIMDAQATRQQRLAAADDVLVNEAPLDQIRCKAERLHREYLRASSDR